MVKIMKVIGMKVILMEMEFLNFIKEYMKVIFYKVSLMDKVKLNGLMVVSI